MFSIIITNTQIMSANASPSTVDTPSRRSENVTIPEILVRTHPDSSSNPINLNNNNYPTLNTPNKIALNQLNSTGNNVSSVKTYFANTLGPSVLLASCSVNSNNSNILNTNHMNQSALFVNVKELNLQLYNEVIVSWNILEETSTHDFIGIYKLSKYYLHF